MILQCAVEKKDSTPVADVQEENLGWWSGPPADSVVSQMVRQRNVPLVQPTLKVGNHCLPRLAHRRLYWVNLRDDGTHNNSFEGFSQGTTALNRVTHTDGRQHRSYS